MAAKTSRGDHWIALLFVFGVVVVGLLAGVVFVIKGFLHLPTLPQPKFGFVGDWKQRSVHGNEERPLPPAAEVWNDYQEWIPLTNAHARKSYIARLGIADRQFHFRSWTNEASTSDAPLGGVDETCVQFTYHDPTNGVYVLTWDLRGRHDVGFLKFDDTERLYQLRLLENSQSNQPPILFIEGIEGIDPQR